MIRSLFRRRSRLLTGALAAAALAATAVTGGAVGAVAAPAVAGHVQHVCGTPSGHRMACLSEVLVPSAARRRAMAASSTPEIDGLRPKDIASAYDLSGGSTGLVGIVDAYDDPELESDLAHYRSQWGLPACTTKNGCFTKVDQRGSTTKRPDQDADWGLEEALDVEAVSAACPDCRILMVEADSPSDDDLGAAENEAVKLGAKAVSNSFGGVEVTGVQAEGKQYYSHPGVALLAATGDGGFPAAGPPASYTTVNAIGGTTLTKSSSASRGWKETAWEGGGSGCSAYIAKPSWQPEDHCPMRTIGDASADADPDSGLAVYDTFGTDDYTDTGWIQVGGTSLSTPLMAGMVVRAGKAKYYGTGERFYKHEGLFNDITSGSNGSCGGDSLCTAKKGYDAPTGVGTPKSLSSF